MSHSRFITAAGIVAAVVLLAFVALKAHLPVQFSQRCQLLPQAEWLLMQTDPDTFEARLTDHHSGTQQNFDLFRVRGGDYVRFSMARDLPPGTPVTAGDAVAYIRSLSAQSNLDQIQYELQEAEAELRAAETGEKDDVIAQARGEMAAARALLTQAEADFKRSEELRNAGVLSQAEFEIASGRFDEARGQVEAAESALRAAEAGEKEEVVAVYQATVEVLRRRLADALIRTSAETIRTPIGGYVATLESDTALLRIADVDTLYAVAPVPVSRCGWLRPGQPATVKIAVTGTADGQLVAIDYHAGVAGGRTFFWVTAAIPNQDGRLRPGTRGELHFRGDKTTLLGWVVDRLRHAGDRTLGA